MKQFSVKCGKGNKEVWEAVQLKAFEDGYKWNVFGKNLSDSALQYSHINFHSKGDLTNNNRPYGDEYIEIDSSEYLLFGAPNCGNLHHTAIMPRKIYPTTPHPSSLSDLSNIRSCDKAHNKMVSCSGDCENCIFTDGWESFKADKVVER
jgi:hypothetical protein